MRPTERFSNRADEYAAGRPQYPAAAIDALLDGLGDPFAIDVADLGAGTGISSRAPAERGCRVVAVEPNAAMRERIGATGTIDARDGTAEATGLATSSFDLVTAFQAFHWFDFNAALAEIARIARSGGRAALVYNTRDESDSTTGGYAEMVRRYADDGGGDARRRGDGQARFSLFEGFADVRRERFENAQRLDREGLRARAFSTSYIPKEGSQARTLQAELDAFFAGHAKRGYITMRMTTIVTIATVR